MIPMFIIYMIRQYRIMGSRKKFFLWMGSRIRSIAPQVITILSIFLIVSITLKAQNMQATYNIIRNGNIAGQLKFQRVVKNDSIFLKTESEAKANFLFTINTYSKEEAIYKNGILLYSSIYRKRNGSEKANKQTRLKDYKYHITTRDKTEVIRSYPIRNNLLSMYCSEPKSASSVYSDFFQQYVPLEKVADSKYKISFPDGNYNYYYYKDGICLEVDVHTSLYSAQIVLNK
ncbi:MAG: DUF6134 family protein [Bacteroidota bacterium]